VAIEIDRPRTKRDFDHIRWHLAHENVNIFIDHKNKWFVEFKTRCSFLTEENFCSVYSSRPKICRDHPGDEVQCEYFNNPYKQYFSSMSQFESYLNEKGVSWQYKRS